MLAWSDAKLKHYQREMQPLLRKLATELVRRGEDFDAEELATAAWALCHYNWRPITVLWRITKEALSRRRSELQPQDISMLLQVNRVGRLEHI